MHEIVSLQFGQQANYIGTHFWNTQESYFTYGDEEQSPVDHDIHFRPGVSPNGQETYSPRTIIYDLKDAFGTLRRENALYQPEAQESLAQSSQWPGQPQILQSPPIPPSPYQQALDEGVDPPPLTTPTVRYWSDYNRIFHHPRSLIPLSQYSLTDSLAPFERWSTGEELFSNLDREHDLLDRDLRPWLEECDQVQAVQVWTGADDAWGGFASRYVERVRDEVGKTGIWVWGLEEGGRRSRQRQQLQTANAVQSLHSLVATASMYIPVTTLPQSLPAYISGFDPGSKWHTSALQVAAIESVGLPSRLKGDQAARAKLDDFETVLSNGGKRRIAHLGLSVSEADVQMNGHANGHHDDRMPGQINGHGKSMDDEGSVLGLDIDLTPELEEDGSSGQRRRGLPSGSGKVFGQVQSLRGMFKSSLEVEDLNYESRNKWSSTAAEGVKLSCHQTSLLQPLLSSYPQIYRFKDSQPLLKEVSIQATLTSSSHVAERVRQLERSARRLIGIEDREAVCEGLLTIAEEYVEGWDGGSDEGSDLGD